MCGGAPRPPQVWRCPGKTRWTWHAAGSLVSVLTETVGLHGESPPTGPRRAPLVSAPGSPGETQGLGSYRGAVHVGALCLGCPNIPGSQRVSRPGVQHEPHALHKRCRHRERCFCYRAVSALPKSRFPDTRQGPALQSGISKARCVHSFLQRAIRSLENTAVVHLLAQSCMTSEPVLPRVGSSSRALWSTQLDDPVGTPRGWAFPIPQLSLTSPHHTHTIPPSGLGPLLSSHLLPLRWSWACLLPLVSRPSRTHVSPLMSSSLCAGCQRSC